MALSKRTAKVKRSSWRNWGDNPIIVALTVGSGVGGLLIGILSISSPQEMRLAQSIQGDFNNQIVGSGNSIGNGNTVVGNPYSPFSDGNYPSANIAGNGNNQIVGSGNSIGNGSTVVGNPYSPFSDGNHPSANIAGNGNNQIVGSGNSIGNGSSVK